VAGLPQWSRVCPQPEKSPPLTGRTLVHSLYGARYDCEQEEGMHSVLARDRPHPHAGGVGMAYAATKAVGA